MAGMDGSLGGEVGSTCSRYGSAGGLLSERQRATAEPAEDDRDRLRLQQRGQVPFISGGCRIAHVGGSIC